MTTVRPPAEPATPATSRRAAPVARGDWRDRYFNRLCVSVLVAFAAIWLLPLIWAAVTSIRPEGEIAAEPASWWSDNWTLEAYRAVLGAGNIYVWYLNSAITASLTAFFSVIVCSMAGFAIARVRYRGKRLAVGLILAGLLIPPQVLIVPMFEQFNALNLLNTYWAMIIPAVPTPIAVFVFASFFAGLPDELADSARVDGASWFRVYRQVFMPLCRPAASAVAIFTFVWSWNSFLWPLLVVTNPDVMTIPVGLATVQSAFGLQYAQIMASALLGALPLVVVFLFFQRRIVEGIANTGIK